MAVPSGARLGGYEVVGLLGVGGMGEVYRARDTRLERQVAIKVLPEAVRADPERVARFEREAKLLASLNHPNIAAIYGLEQAQGEQFIVMELVEGPTLADRIAEGPIPTTEALPIAKQIADALEAAHEAGVIHRDLKPANIKVTHGSRVKILDFGLAKGVAANASGADCAEAITRAVNATRPGTILGTPSYMSPEQARGYATDARTDIWSFGCVLFEMLTSRQAFSGPTTVDVIGALIASGPNWDLLPGGTPPELTDLLEGCLQKDAERRYARIAEVRLRLEGAFSAPAPSIAVLSFENMTADPENEYFSDGMAEEIINALSHVEGLRVTGRTSSFAFKGRQHDLREIGAKLGVGALLEGGVRRAGNRVRITARLVDVSTGYDLWSERWDRELADVFAIQDEIANLVANRLRASLVAKGIRGERQRPTESLEAYEAYLRGRFYWNKGTTESYRRSRDYFERALELDHRFAQAYAGLGETLVYSRLFAQARDRMLELEQAREVTRKALDLDPSLGEAHSVLAQLFLFHDWNWAAADREARRAIALNEGSAPAHVSWAVSLVNLGRYDEAVAECRRAVELDPLWARGHQALQFALVQAGRHAESIAVGRKLLELEPDFVLAHITLAFAFVETGAYENAERSCEAAFRSAPAHPLGTSVLVRARVQTGQMSEARRCLENFLHADGEAAGPGAAAIMYGYLGEPDEAFRYLERAIELRDEVMVCLPTWTFWNPLRSDPRFEALLRRLNFPQYSLDAHFARLRSELGSRESAATPLP